MNVLLVVSSNGVVEAVYPITLLYEERIDLVFAGPKDHRLPVIYEPIEYREEFGALLVDRHRWFYSMVEAGGIEPPSDKFHLARLRACLATGQPVALVSRSVSLLALATTGQSWLAY